MATTVDTLLVRIEADLKDVNSKLAKFERNVDNTQTRASRSFNKIATVAKGVFAAAIVAQTARAGLALVNFASGVEEMQAKSSVVFGEFTKSVRQELESFGDAVGRSTHELEGMAASVQDTFVPLGFARGEAAQLSTQLTKLAVDVASFNNASDTETMRAFQSAIVGNHETVRRFGIIITEATLQQELYRMGINKSTQEASNQEKVQARLNLIMSGTTDAQGDAARTADSFANRSKALSAALEELAVNVLTPLLPALSGIVGGLVDATNAMNGFLDAIGVIDLDPIASKSEELAEKQAALAKAQENVAYWTRITNGEFDGLFDPARLLGAKAIENGLANATEEVERLSAESQQAFAELQKLTGADQAQMGRPAPAKPSAPEKDTRTVDQTNKITEALDNQRFAAQQLKDQLDGVSQSRLEANAIAREMKGITQEETDQLQFLIDIENEYQKLLNEKIDKEKDDAEVKARGKKAIEDLDKANQILALETMPRLTEAEKAFKQELIELGEITPEHRAELESLFATNQKLTKETKEIKKAQDAHNKSVQAGVDFVATFTEAEDVLKETQLALNEAFAAGKINFDEYQQGMKMLETEMKRLDPMFKSVEEAAQRAGDAIADSLAEAVVEGKLSMDTFQNIFKQFVKELIAEAIKTFIIKKILAMFTGGFGGGGSVGSGSSSFGGDSFMAFAGGGKIPARATGGPVLVGERGPELFIPHSAGTIKNKQDTKNMLQGGGAPVNVYQTIQVDTGVSQTVKTEMMNMLPRFKAETMQAVIDGKRRGKAISKVFA